MRNLDPQNIYGRSGASVHPEVRRLDTVIEAAADGKCAATAAAARALRHRVSDESWERLAFRLELR